MTAVEAFAEHDRVEAAPAVIILAAQAVSQRFGKRRALEAVDLSLAAGHVVGLLGPNGAGKSTLLAVLAGHLRPTTGTVAWSSSAGNGGARRRLGMLPQGAPLPPDETPRRLLRQWARLQHLTDAEAGVSDILQATGLERVADARLRTLSGGEQKLVAIGQAFLGAPEVVLLDEPTSALDPWGRQRLRALIRAHKAAGHALLLASHNLPEVEQLCDDVVVLRDGRVHFSGALAALLGASRELDGQVMAGRGLEAALTGAFGPSSSVDSRKD